MNLSCQHIVSIFPYFTSGSKLNSKGLSTRSQKGIVCHHQIARVLERESQRQLFEFSEPSPLTASQFATMSDDGAALSAMSSLSPEPIPDLQPEELDEQQPARPATKPSESWDVAFVYA